MYLILTTFFPNLCQQHFSVIVALLQQDILIIFANFNARQCKQTHVRVHKSVKRPETLLHVSVNDVALFQSRNVVNGALLVALQGLPLIGSKLFSKLRKMYILSPAKIYLST